MKAPNAGERPAWCEAQAEPTAVTIAIVHLLFNAAGIALIYPLAPVRRIPIRLASALADFSMRSRAVPILYLLFLFFLLPGVILLLRRSFAGA